MHTICLIAISKDFFESDLPKPELSGDEDDLPERLWKEFLSSILGGANFRIFITLSTILVPITTGLTLSFALEYARLTAGIELPVEREMPLLEHPLEGEHDCRLGLPLEVGSTDEDRGLDAPGLPLVVDSGLSGSDVLKLGGASSEKPGISDGFHDLDFTVGEVPRDGTGCLDITGADLETEEVLTEGEDTVGTLDGVDGCRAGVDALVVGLDAGKVGLAVGVEDLAVDLDNGVEDLDVIVVLAADTVVVLVTETAVLGAETMGLAEETEVWVEATVVLVEAVVVQEVGVEGLDDFETVVGVEGLHDFETVVAVEGLDDFETVVNVDRRAGVADRDPIFPDDECLLVIPPEEVNPGEEADCLDTKLLLPLCSDRFPDDEGLLIPPPEEVHPGEEAGCLITELLLPVSSDRFPADEGLLIPPPEEVNPGEEAGCLDTKLLLPACSDGELANYNHKKTNT